MFDRIFDLPRRPFTATPDPACFFVGEAIQAALDELVVCVERGQGIGILTADPGLGKTLLCQCLVRELNSHFQPVFLSNSNIADCRSLLQTILCELGEDYSGKAEHELRLALRQRIQRLRPSHQALVLIVDEAHHFATEVLEEIRLLADIADAGQSLVRVILSGQMSLEERLTERAFDALNQRICAHVTLLPMTLSESRDYLEFRIQWAGGKSESVMTYLAVQLIARASAGVPRCLNQLADHCLLLATASGERPVGPETVREALAELKQLPLQWNDLHELSSFATVGKDDDAADFETEADNEAAAMSSTDAADQDLASPQWSAPVANSSASKSTSVAAAETSAFEFGGDAPVSDAMAQESSVAASASQSPFNSTASDVIAEPVSNNIEARFDPLSTDGVCITISSPRRSRTQGSKADSPHEFQSQSNEQSGPLGSAATTLKNNVPPATAAAIPRAATTFRQSIAASIKDLSAKPHSATHKDLPVPKFVEEIVVDHYAALQEPEFSGIIWNLARQSDSTTSTDAAVSEAAASHQPAALGATGELPCVTIEFGPGSSFDSAPVVATPAVAKPAVARPAASVPAKVTQKREEVRSEEPQTDDFVSGIRPLQPTRFLDAIMPLIGEVLDNDDNDYEANARRMWRAEGEVEASLIDELATGELEIEDQIAAEVLDLRIDTQAAIRQSRLLEMRSLERDLKSVPSCDDDDFDAVLRDYDVVQPPEVPKSKHASNVEHLAPSGREHSEGQAPQEPPTETTRRPFGRLFTELRRRQQ